VPVNGFWKPPSPKEIFGVRKKWSHAVTTASRWLEDGTRFSVHLCDSGQFAL